MEHVMLKVSKSEWDKIPSDYKGIWQAYYGEHQEWKGRNVVMSTCLTHRPEDKCALLVEGVHFVIEQNDATSANGIDVDGWEVRE